jgi:MFS family permease
MATTESISPNYQIITNETGRVFRVGEEPRQILGYSRGVVLMAAWFVMCLAGLLEYTWGTVSGSLAAAHHWSIGQTFWAFSFFVIFESFVQIFTGMLRNRGILDVKWATIIGGVICGIVGYGLLAESNSIWQAYLGYAALGGIGSGMVYSGAINIVAKWYPEKKGWRTGFVNGGWAYGAVPFIIVIGDVNGSAITMTPSQIRNYIIIQGAIMSVGIAIGGWFMKDPPKNWWPKEIDPLNWQKNSTRDLLSNPPALRHYTLGQMWRTPQSKWIGIQYALFIGCSLFGVAYYYPFAQAMKLGTAASVAGFAGFEYIGRRRTMVYAYSGNVVFQLATYFAGAAHNAPLFVIFAIISGGLSGANFPMTAAMVSDYYGETNNAVNYGSIYAFKALGGSFAGGGAALIMTGTLYGTATYHWAFGFFFGAAIGALAALTVWFLCKPPTKEQMARAVELSEVKEAQKANPAIA